MKLSLTFFKRAVGTLLTICGSFFLTSTIYAASPPNLNADINWTDTGGVSAPENGINSATFNGVVDIEAAFNHARRQEESQFNIPANTLTDLDLPTQEVWDGMSDDEKALFIINAERTARADMLGDGTVIGLPLEGMESNIDNIAQNYAEVLISENAFAHYEPSGNSTVDNPFLRLGNDPVLDDCHELIPRIENLAAFWTTGSSTRLPIARSIYNWVYDDASSLWGHREAVLIQDQPLVNQGLSGFSNNVNEAASEGFLGIGRASSANYDPFGFNLNFGEVVVMNIFDPVPNAGCPFLTVQETATPRPTAIPSATPTPTLMPTETSAPAATDTPTAAPTAVSTATATPTPTAIPSATPTNRPENTATPIPTAIPPTAIPSLTPTPTLIPSATPTLPSPSGSSVTISPDTGGELSVELTDMTVNISIPTGAVGQPVDIIIEESPIQLSPNQGLEAVGNIFNIAGETGNDQPITQLNQSFTLRINFGNVTSRRLANLEENPTRSLYTYDSTTNTWRLVPSTVDMQSQTVEAELNQLAVFAVLDDHRTHIHLPLVQR